MLRIHYTILLICLLAVSCKRTNIPIEATVTPLTSKYNADQEVDINVSDSITISGSLVYGGSDVLSIFIAGSGPTDRDCNSVAGVNTNAFLMMADSLKNAGISSYRYDKRGVGKSIISDPSKNDFNDFVSDANSIVEFFKDDFNHINIIGHSEGALIGTLISRDNPNVKSLVNLSGMSIPLDSLILDQIGQFPKLVEEAKLHFEEIRTGDTLSQVSPFLVGIFNPYNITFLNSVVAYHPSLEHAKVKVPVFVIGGNCDLQVSEEHAEKLFSSLPPDNDYNQYLIIEDMGHVLKQNKTDCSDNQASYNDPTKPLHGLLVKSLTEFILAVSE